MSGLELRPLADGDFDPLHRAFLDAFSDYVVKLAPTPEQLRETLTRRGWVPHLSCGVFEDDRMVAFTSNGVTGEIAYDSGTGVAPSHRRRGLAAEMMAFSKTLLRHAGLRRYVLEVIDSNRGAIELYLRCGFQETRPLQCWTYETAAGAQLPFIDRPDWDALASSWDAEPSWQNTIASVRRATDAFRVIGDDRGYAVVFPATGDVPQLAVAKDHRRQGFGRRLLDAAGAIAGKPLRIVNVDARDGGIERFLETCGARRTLRQIEMAVAL